MTKNDFANDLSDNYFEVIQNIIVANIVSHGNNFGPHGINEILQKHSHLYYIRHFWSDQTYFKNESQKYISYYQPHNLTMYIVKL